MSLHGDIFLGWSTTNIFHFVRLCMIIAHFTCIMCKMASKATYGIYGVQSYKCDKDVYPTDTIFNFLNIGIIIAFYQGPVVQSVVSLTSSLRIISLTVLADSVHNILIFFAEKM